MQKDTSGMFDPVRNSYSREERVHYFVEDLKALSAPDRYSRSMYPGYRGEDFIPLGWGDY